MQKNHNEDITIDNNNEKVLQSVFNYAKNNPGCNVNIYFITVGSNHGTINLLKTDLAERSDN